MTPENPAAPRGLRRPLLALARTLVALGLGLGTGGALAATGGEVCRAAARTASAETGVPVAVLDAIALTETGRKRGGAVTPWPWTVNMEGAGHWFDSFDEALSFAVGEHGRGKRSFDVGCFQLNFRWHGQAFRSVEHMFDPVANARYAADFLRRLYRETGSWSAAAGAYHSRTPKHATRYRKIFDRHFAALSSGGATVYANANDFGDAAGGDLEAEPMRQNGFPLLIASGESGRMGSLVPLGRSADRLIPLQPARALH